MQGLLNPAALTSLPSVADWLQLAAGSVARAKLRDPEATGESLFQAVIEQNVLMQIEHVQTYPVVQEAAAAGHLRLHAWVYQFESGQVTVYDAQRERFVLLSESPRQKLLVPMPVGGPAAEIRSM